MIGALLRTLVSRFLLLLLMVVYIIPTLILICIPARWRYNSRIVFWIIHGFYWAVIRFSLLPITYVGTENIPKNKPVIFVANHQSSLDIPLVGYLAKGTPHIWLALQTLMKSPILRWILPRLAVLVNTESKQKAMRSLIQILRFIQGKKIHVMIFPEGGRYTDDDVHEFFGGFVLLAKKTGRPVVPVRIFGANKVYPPKAFLIHWHPIKVVVGKPFVYQDGEDDKVFKQRVYQWFIDQKE